MIKKSLLLYLVLAIAFSVILITAFAINNQPTAATNNTQHSKQNEEVPHLNKKGVYDAIFSGKYTFLEFGGRTCIPCRRMQPILMDLHNRYGSVMNVYNVYLEDDPSIARDFRINLIPTQIIFDENGVEIGRHVGYWEQTALLAELQKLGII